MSGTGKPIKSKANNLEGKNPSESSSLISRSSSMAGIDEETGLLK